MVTAGLVAVLVTLASAGWADRPRALGIGVAGLLSVIGEVWATTRWGASLGQRVLGVRTAGPDGGRPVPASAWLRAAALGPFAIGAPVCAIGVLRAGHRGGHDRVAATVVLPAGPALPILPWPGPLARPRMTAGDAVVAMWSGVWASLLVSLVAGGLGVGASPAATFLLVLPAQTLGTLLTVAAVLRLKGSGSARADLGFAVRARHAGYLLLGPPLHLLAGIVLAPILALLGRSDPPVQAISTDAADATGLLITAATVLGLVIVGPATEELVFRGLLLRSLLRRMPEARAVAISAAAFALVHLLDPGAWPIVPGLFVLGWVLARLTLGEDGTLSRAIFAHAGFNLVSVIASRLL